jgi:hypothetical protein
MSTQNMVAFLPKFLPPYGVWRLCVLGKHYQVPFEYGKAWLEENLLELVHSNICCIN